MEKEYNKLVRDNIIDIIISNGEHPVYRELVGEEFWFYLLEKDIEELEEVRNAKSSEEVKKELSDKLEILIAMANYHGFILQDIIDAAEEKRNKNGGFDKKLFLEKVIE